MKLLFVIANTRLTGGNKILFELINRLVEIGHFVDVAFYYTPGQQPDWLTLNGSIILAQPWKTILQQPYEYVILSHAFLMPVILPDIGDTCPVYFSQAYEGFCYGDTYEELMEESPVLQSILQIPIPMISVSQSLQQLLQNRAGRESFYLPLAIDKSRFYPRRRTSSVEPKRILMVGSYLEPVKGMSVGFKALKHLQSNFEIQLVLITQEYARRDLLTTLPYPVEIHDNPPQESIPDIYASVHAYCCPSFYETFPLPPLEAFACGVPVVSTCNDGVMNYAEPGINLLLAQCNDSLDLARQLKQVLLDESLAERLRQGGFKTIEGDYNWSATVERFIEILQVDIPTVYSTRLAPDTARLIQLQHEMEQEGIFTPYTVQQQYQACYKTFEVWADQMMRQPRSLSPSNSCWLELQWICDRLKSLLVNEQAQYYLQVKSLYDLCRFLWHIREEAQFTQYLTQLRQQYKAMP
jgi:L-malate glycosyltransferase